MYINYRICKNLIPFVFQALEENVKDRLVIKLPLGDESVTLDLTLNRYTKLKIKLLI